MLNEKLSFEGHIYSLPTLTWAKNKDFQYIASSKRLINLLGCITENQLYQDDDFNQPWSQYANIYRNEDQQILKGKSLAFLHPIKLFSGEDVLVITRKFPLYNSQKTICGITGNITITASPQIIKNFSALRKTDFEISAINSFEPGRYQMGDLFDNLNLTKRETTCLFYLVRGKTAKEIADLLFISKRTAEKHIISIKNKFKCNTKLQIIEKAIELGFVSFIPNGFLHSTIY